MLPSRGWLLLLSQTFVSSLIHCHSLAPCLTLLFTPELALVLSFCFFLSVSNGEHDLLHALKRMKVIVCTAIAAEQRGHHGIWLGNIE